MSNSDDIVIKEANSLRDKYIFASLPHRIYKEEPAFTPPIILERMLHFKNRKSNPNHIECVFFLAYRNGHPVGRIAVHICRFFQENINSKKGLFGFIDAIDDQAVFNMLLKAAKDWLLQRGKTEMEGPYSFSTNDECGVLIEGHDIEQTFMYPYHPLYVHKRLEEAGLNKIKDLYSYDFVPEVYMEFRRNNVRFSKLIERYFEKIKKNGDKRYLYSKNEPLEHFERVIKFYNEVWKNNWRFSTLTPLEKKLFYYMLYITKHNSYLSIVENKDKEVLSLVYFVQSMNEWIKGMNGKLFPFNIFRIIYRIIFLKPKKFRGIIAGVSEQFHGKQEAAFIFAAAIENCMKMEGEFATFFKYKRGEVIINAGWILEDNKGMNSIMEIFAQAKRSHVFRLYECSL